MSVSRKVALGGAGAAVLALGIAVPAAAFAQDPSPTPSASAGTDRDAQRQARQDSLAEKLAAELGIDKDKVAAALDKAETELRDEAKADRQAALKERLATAVSEGKLTQEQADAILAASDAGVLGGFGGPGGRGHGPGR